MDKLLKTSDLDAGYIDTFINIHGSDAEQLLHDDMLVKNEVGQLVLISAEICRDGIKFIVTDLLDTGYMIDHCFLPDGTITVSNKYR